jgi:formylglycine-generating enzyme required for sulfatase activity
MFPLQQDGSIIILTMADLKLALGAEQKTGPGLVLIEGGRFTMGQVAAGCYV